MHMRLNRGELVVASGQGIVPVAVEGGSHRSPRVVSALVSEQITRMISLGDISRIKAYRPKLALRVPTDALSCLVIPIPTLIKEYHVKL